jgi:uncharacterized protein with HEPN domain
MSDSRDHGTILSILEAIQHIRDYTRSISNAEDVYSNTMVFDDYLGIDAEEVWQIVTGDIPELEQQILSLKDEFEGHESEDS